MIFPVATLSCRHGYRSGLLASPYDPHLPQRLLLLLAPLGHLPLQRRQLRCKGAP